MELDICYNQATGKVAFVEASSSFLDLLEELKHITPVDLSTLLSMDPRKEHLFSPFCDFIHPASGPQPPSVATLHPELVQILKGVLEDPPGRTGTIQDPSLHVCTYGCHALVFPWVAQTQCPLCRGNRLRSVGNPFSESSTGVCAPKPIRFIPSVPGQGSLDLDLPIYRCTNGGCCTFSNSRLAPCTECNRGLMGLNAALLSESGSEESTVVADPRQQTNPPQPGAGMAFLTFEARIPLIVSADITDKELADQAWPVGPPTLEGDLERPVFACSRCHCFMSNTFGRQCAKCIPCDARTIFPCTVVTRKEGRAREVEYHPHGSGSPEAKEHEQQMALLDDNLKIYPKLSFIQRLRLLKETGIFNLEDMANVTKTIGPGEVLAMCKTGHQPGCPAFFSEAFKSSLK